MDRDRILESLRSYFERASSVQTAYLFGSQARGQAGAGSDVDIAVLRIEPLRPVLSSLPLDLEAEIDTLLGLPAQVIDLRSAPVDLVHRVLRDGVLLADRDPSARIRFEVRSRNEYFDLLPFVRRYRERTSA